MGIDRREAMRLGGGAVALFAAPALSARAPARATAPSLLPGGAGLDKTSELQTALDFAASSRTPLALPPGLYPTRRLTLRSGTHVLGVPGKTVLLCRETTGLLQIFDAKDVRIEGLVLDGRGVALEHDGSLLTALSVERLQLTSCRLISATGHGIVLRRVSGCLMDCEIAATGGVGILGEDVAELKILRNRLKDGGSTIRLTAGEDCHISGNIVERADNGVALMQANCGAAAERAGPSRRPT